MPSHIPNLIDRSDCLDSDQISAMANGLRAMADWLEKTEFPIPRSVLYSGGMMLSVFSSWFNDQDFARRPSSAIRLIGGKVRKNVDYKNSPYFDLDRDFGGGVKFRYTIARDAVCEAKEVPTTVETDGFTDEERATQLQAELDALKTKKTVPGVKVVYNCPPSLLAKDETEVTTA